MRCSVCGYPDGPCKRKKMESSYFYIYLRKRFLKSMTVPCFMRARIDNMGEKSMFVATEVGKEYLFKLNKGFHKTRIYGSDYNKMLSDYKMKRGDRIRIKFVQKYPFVKISPEEMVNEDDQEEIRKGPHVFKDSASVGVFSGGLEQTAAQTSRMNHCVLTRGLGLGAVYVHTLTMIDIKTIGLRIPKDIVPALNIFKKGHAILNTENGNKIAVKEATFYSSKDGRVCLTKGWFSFAKDNGFKPGKIILVLFDKDNDDFLNLYFDVL